MTERRTPAARTRHRARALVAAQAQELAALRAPLTTDFAGQLRHSLLQASLVEALRPTGSHRDLLNLIVRSAVRVIDAGAAGLLLIDRAAGDMVFEVVIGGGGDAVAQQRIPLGQGIAGWVAVTGQPIAVADTASDSRFVRRHAESVGYVPKSILCVPMQHDDEIIGVLEVLDKQTGEFTSRDIETLSLFAEQATVAIQQSLTFRGLGALLARQLDALVGAGDALGRLSPASGRYAAALAEDPSWTGAIELADLITRIAAHGEGERAYCHLALGQFADYLDRRRRLFEPALPLSDLE